MLSSDVAASSVGRVGAHTQPDREHRPVVVVYRREFLPISETFVMDHLTHLDRWDAAAICESFVEGGLTATDVAPIRIFGPAAGRLDHWKMSALGRNRVLDDVVDRTRARLIHAHFLPGGERIAALARRRRIPLIVTAHGADATVWPGAKPPGREAVLAAVRAARLRKVAARIVCVSNFIHGELVGRGFAPEKLVTLPLGVDPAAFEPGPPASARTGVVFAARLVEKKGLRFLLEAWPKLPPALRSTPLRIVGDGPLRAELEALAGALGVPASFLGARPRGEVSALMKSARVFAFPSTRAANGDAEGMGIVAIEAQALGAPVLAFDACTGREVLSDGRSGLLVADRDRAALAAGLARLLGDDALADRLGAGGPAVVRERFDLHRNTRRLERLYDEVAAQARASRGARP